MRIVAQGRKVQATLQPYKFRNSWRRSFSVQARAVCPSTAMTSASERPRIIFSDIDGTLAFSKLGNAKLEPTEHGTLVCTLQHDGQVFPRTACHGCPNKLKWGALASSIA